MVFGRDGKRDSEGRRFQMREDLLSIGGDYMIEDEESEQTFRVDGKAARLRDTWLLENGRGVELAKIREKKLSVRDAVTIEMADGREVKVKKEIVSIRDRFSIDVDPGDDMTAKGNIADHEYEVERNGDTIAEVSKKWFRVRDTYGVEVLDESETALVLAIAVALDALSGS